MLCRPRSLSGLAADVLAFVFDSLALVRLGGTESADVGGRLSDHVLAGAAHRHAGGTLDLDGDALRRFEPDRMRKAELQHQRASVHLRAGGGADDLERL